MKVLIVTQYFWPEDFRVNELAAGIAERGHLVTVLTGMPNYPGGRLFEGYRWWRPRRQTYGKMTVLRAPLVPRGNAGAVRLILNYLSFAVAASALWPFHLKGERYDVIFVFQPSPVTAALPAICIKKFTKTPIVFWVLDLWPESLSAAGGMNSKLLKRVADALVRFIYRRCDLILTSSRSFRISIESKGVAAGRIRYFPNWAETAYHPAPSGRAAVDELPDGFRILFAGNIGEAQDFGTILGAAEKLLDEPKIKWIILGDGRKAGWVREQVVLRGLENNFRLLGRRPSAEMPDYFARADVLLATLRPDPLFALTVPGKLQSYLACGRPVIAALDGEGGRIVSESGAGIAVPAGRADDLAEAVMKMYRLPKEQREKMGKLGRSYCAEHFDRETLLARLESWLRALASGLPAAPGE